MWLVLCTTDDLSALWAAGGLTARGLQPVEIVTAEALAYNRRLEHRLTGGQSSVKITLADGRVIDSATVRGTLNRLQIIPSSHLHTNSKDRQYAEQELYALYLSWLYALPGKMLNRPTPQGLSGECRHPSEWVWLANQAGLKTAPYGQSELRRAPSLQQLPLSGSRTIIVVDGICCGAPAPREVTDGCSRLSARSATKLLGVDFEVTSDEEWIFNRATPFPDLRLGGDKLNDSLAQALNS
jgi:hypothetical protein